MSDAGSTVISPAKKNRRWLAPVVTIAFVVGLPAAGWLLFNVDGPWATANMHHQHVLRRIDNHYTRAMATFPLSSDGMSQQERGRYEIVRAFGTSMINTFRFRRDCVPEKVESIADRLDATDGADLKTFEGCCELLVLCDEASWQFSDYSWTEYLRGLEKEGAIPKLPVLGKRWEKDPRYLAYKGQ